jgi:hypothetical protein
MAKKLKPTNIEQLSALIAILRPGCIAGDTKVSTKTYVHTDGRVRYHNVSIRDMAKNPSKYKTILSYNENTGKFTKNTVLNIFYTGDKECFKVVLTTQERLNSSFGNKQYKLECTADHKLLTPDGWKELKDIKIGERILVNKRQSTRKNYHKKSFRHWCYHTYQYRCIFCDWSLGSLDVNHIKDNRLINNHPDNLCFLCPNHHRQFSEGSISENEIYTARAKYVLPLSEDGKWATLQKKIPVGKKDVYDISMSSPHHNFIAGGIIVHNCLEAMRDGKSVSNHYIDKKNGQESVDYFHPALEPILKTSYGEMIYQEQAMEIAKVIAGFNLQEADMLRKAIGKKKPEEMAKVKEKFLTGSKNLGIVTVDEAEQIFGWIEKSQRYSFNKSHSVSYAINAYLSAYAKAHFPKIFFASYLRFAKDKIDPQAEIKELTQNANEMDITVSVPDFRNLNQYFILNDNKIFFGLTDIKGVGQSVFNKLLELKEKNLDLNSTNWLYILTNVLMNINSTAAKALIQSGALSYVKKTRNSMLFEYELISELTKKEIEFIKSGIDKYSCIEQGLKDLIAFGKANKNRKVIISTILSTAMNPPRSLVDSPEWLSDAEYAALGCSITCSKVDMYDISMTNATCKDFKNGIVRENIIVGGEIDYINVTKTKSGKNPGLEMAFVTLLDSTGSMDSVVFFPEQYREYRNVLFQGNVVIVKGARSKSGDAFVVEKCYIPKS